VWIVTFRVVVGAGAAIALRSARGSDTTDKWVLWSSRSCVGQPPHAPRHAARTLCGPGPECPRAGLVIRSARCFLKVRVPPESVKLRSLPSFKFQVPTALGFDTFFRPRQGCRGGHAPADPWTGTQKQPAMSQALLLGCSQVQEGRQSHDSERLLVGTLTLLLEPTAVKACAGSMGPLATRCRLVVLRFSFALLGEMCSFNLLLQVVGQTLWLGKLKK
jgi:hypothetical protein